MWSLIFFSLERRIHWSPLCYVDFRAGCQHTFGTILGDMNGLQKCTWSTSLKIAPHIWSLHILMETGMAFNKHEYLGQLAFYRKFTPVCPGVATPREPEWFCAASLLSSEPLKGCWLSPCALCCITHALCSSGFLGAAPGEENEWLIAFLSPHSVFSSRDSPAHFLVSLQQSAA